MAIVIISGNVSNVSDGGRFTVWEEFEVQGKRVFRKWTVWNNQPGIVADHDWVELKGTLGSKVGSYEKDGETRAVVDHSLNEPRIIRHVPSTTSRFGSDGKADAPADDVNAPF